MIKLEKEVKKEVEKLLSGKLAAGMYRLTSEADANALLTEIREQGGIPFYFDGRAITDKASFLRMAAAALNFPDYFGSNWDAFEECVTDLEWIAKGPRVVIYDYVSKFSEQNQKEWGVANSILADAAEQSKEGKAPLYVLLRHAADYGKDLPQI